MALVGDRDCNLAELLGIAPASMSARINGKIDFSRTEIQKIIQHYNLKSDEAHEIFFAMQVVENDNTMESEV
jgi:hypothetical protein